MPTIRFHGYRWLKKTLTTKPT